MSSHSSAGRHCGHGTMGPWLPVVLPCGVYWRVLSPALLWDASMAAQSCVPGTRLPFSRATSPAAPLGQLCQGSACSPPALHHPAFFPCARQEMLPEREGGSSSLVRSGPGHVPVSLHHMLALGCFSAQVQGGQDPAALPCRATRLRVLQAALALWPAAGPGRQKGEQQYGGGQHPQAWGDCGGGRGGH